MFSYKEVIMVQKFNCRRACWYDVCRGEHVEENLSPEHKVDLSKANLSVENKADLSKVNLSAVGWITLGVHIL